MYGGETDKLETPQLEKTRHEVYCRIKTCQDVPLMGTAVFGKRYPSCLPEQGDKTGRKTAEDNLIKAKARQECSRRAFVISTIPVGRFEQHQPKTKEPPEKGAGGSFVFPLAREPHSSSSSSSAGGAKSAKTLIKSTPVMYLRQWALMKARIASANPSGRYRWP